MTGLDPDLVQRLRAPLGHLGRQPWPTDPEEIPAVPKTVQDLVYIAEQDPALMSYEDKARSIVAKVPATSREAALGAFIEECLVLRRQWRAARETLEEQRDDVMDRMSEIRRLDINQLAATEVASRSGFPNPDAMQKWLQARGESELWKSLAARDPELARERRERSKRRRQAKAEAAAVPLAETVPGTVTANLPAAPDAKVTETTPSPVAPVHASRKTLAVAKRWEELMATEVAMPDGSLAVIEQMTADQLTEVAHALFDTSEQLHALADAINAAGVGDC